MGQQHSIALGVKSRMALAAMLAGAMVSGVSLAGTPDAATATATASQQVNVAQLQQEIESLKGQVAQLKAKSDSNWLTQERTQQITQIVNSVLKDSKTRSQYLDNELQAGYDNGFFIRTADKNFQLTINGYMQFRYMYQDAMKGNNNNAPSSSGAPGGPYSGPLGNSSEFRFIGISEDAAPTVGWRDLHLRLTGPQQQEVSQSFLRSWNYAKGIPLPWRPTEYRRVRLRTTDESIHFFDSGPGLKFSRGPRVYRRLLLGAQRSVVIAMAYVIPVGRVMGELMAARHRGVRFTVLVPAKADVRLPQLATDSMYRKLLRARVRIYERTNRMMHTKLMIVDRQWSVVGSSNMDPRSLWTNLEFLAVIRSRPFAEAMSAIARYELRHSQRVNLADIARRGRLHRIISALAWQLRWWL